MLTKTVLIKIKVIFLNLPHIAIFLQFILSKGLDPRVGNKAITLINIS